MGNEHIKVTFPPDGDYLVAAHGWGIQEGETFDLAINLIQGADLQLTGLPEGPYPPSTPITFSVVWTLDAPLAANGEAFGLVLLVPPGAEVAV